MPEVNLVYSEEKRGYPCPHCEDVFFANRPEDHSAEMMQAIDFHFRYFHSQAYE